MLIIKKYLIRLKENNNNIFDNLNQSFNNKNELINDNSTINNDVKYNTQIKEKYSSERFTIYKTLAKSKDNIIRITTYKKIKKNKINLNISSENKNNGKNTVLNDKNNAPSNNTANDNKIIKENNQTSTSINDNNNKDNKINLTSVENENGLLQYDIFNQNKNYFKLNKKKDKKPFKSVKSKELTNFLIKEYCDSVSDKVPRSKKLYDESNLNTENKSNVNFIFNNNKENKGKINEEKIIAIKEENNDNLKYVNKNEFDLEDFVYNPFRDCYAKIRKF